MGNLQSNNPNSQPAPIGANQEANTYEDEINLVDYFRVLWKHKYFILLGSFLPALIVGLILSFWPRNFKATYAYDVEDLRLYNVEGLRPYDVEDLRLYNVEGLRPYNVEDLRLYNVEDQGPYDKGGWNLNEKNYNVLLSKFYSEENIGKIISKLRTSGLNRYAELISRARGRGDLKKLVDFEVLPPYIDLSKAKVTDPANLERLRQIKAQLLSMTITGRPESSIPQISSVIRDNLENVIPVCLVEEQLKTAARGYKTKMTEIGENRFEQKLSLKTNKSVLAKLKNIETKTLDKAESNITVQFNISDRTEYLPLGYQVQAAESKIIKLEEKIRADEEKYDYYKDLLALNKKLLAELKNKVSSYYTIQQFHSFLTDLVDSSKNMELKGYLNSYIKRIENRISVSAPIIGKPKVYAVSKGTVKKSAIVFAISVMLSVFVAFLLEGLRKSQTQAS